MSINLKLEISVFWVNTADISILHYNYYRYFIQLKISLGSVFHEGISISNRVSEQMMVFNLPLTARSRWWHLKIRTSDPMLTTASHLLPFQIELWSDCN